MISSGAPPQLAAKNILAAGHAVLAGGAGPLGAAVKPEPLAA